MQANIGGHKNSSSSSQFIALIALANGDDTENDSDQLHDGKADGRASPHLPVLQDLVVNGLETALHEDGAEWYVRAAGYRTQERNTECHSGHGIL